MNEQRTWPIVLALLVVGILAVAVLAMLTSARIG